MDGNGRWAVAQGLPRLAGHRRGVEAVRRAIEAAPGLGVSSLTLYAFSSDNWKRPGEEVSGLMHLLEQYLLTRVEECLEKGLRLSFLGRRDRLPVSLARLMDRVERRTEGGARLHVRIAIDYSSRDTLVEAARRIAQNATRQSISELLPAPDVDLLIRTGGEQRLSDFLLWECAYAELLFLPVMWPEFEASHLADAVEWFRRRDRRFGKAPAA